MEGLVPIRSPVFGEDTELGDSFNMVISLNTHPEIPCLDMQIMGYLLLGIGRSFAAGE